MNGYSPTYSEYCAANISQLKQMFEQQKFSTKPPIVDFDEYLNAYGWVYQAITCNYIKKGNNPYEQR